jgi:hypothetical protein
MRKTGLVMIFAAGHCAVESPREELAFSSDSATRGNLHSVAHDGPLAEACDLR